MLPANLSKENMRFGMWQAMVSSKILGDCMTSPILRTYSLNFYWVEGEKMGNCSVEQSMESKHERKGVGRKPGLREKVRVLTY